MVRMFSVLAFLTHVLFALSNPILPTTTVGAQKRAGKYNATELQAEMPSIWWEEAISSCTNDTRLDIIVRAARDAKKMLSGVNTADSRFLYSGAFTQYFGDYHAWMSNSEGSSHIKNERLAATIQNRIRAVTRYTASGGFYSQEKKDRVVFTCDLDAFNGEGCKKVYGAAASTKNRPSGSESPMIMFCDGFFDSPQMKHMHKVIEAGDKGNTDMSQYRTHEGAMIHEFMHVDMFIDHEAHIEDVIVHLDEYGTQVQIYGEEKCRKLALKNGRDRGFLKVAMNADNYAWYFTYQYLNLRWWSEKVELRRTIPSAGQSAINQRQAIHERQDDEDIKMPQNCYRVDSMKDPYGNRVIHCDDIPEPYNEWIQNKAKPFKSHYGCDLSPECRTSRDTLANPECTCTCNGQAVTFSSFRCDGIAGYRGIKQKTKAATIFVKSPYHFTPTQQSWIFIATDYLQKADGCEKSDSSKDITEPGNIVQLDTPKFVKGRFEVVLHEEVCQYSADNDEGRLSCPSMRETVKCSKHEDKDDGRSSQECKVEGKEETYWVHPLIYCEW